MTDKIELDEFVAACSSELKSQEDRDRLNKYAADWRELVRLHPRKAVAFETRTYDDWFEEYRWFDTWGSPSPLSVVNRDRLETRLGRILRDYENKVDFRSSTWTDWDQLINRHDTERLGGLHVQARDKGYCHLVILPQGHAVTWGGGPVKLLLFLWMEEHVKDRYTIRSMIADSETTAAKKDDLIFFFKDADDAARFEARWVP